MGGPIIGGTGVHKPWEGRREGVISPFFTQPCNLGVLSLLCIFSPQNKQNKQQNTGPLFVRNPQSSRKKSALLI